MHYKDTKGSRWIKMQPRAGQYHLYPTSRLRALDSMRVDGNISTALDQHCKSIGGPQEEQEQMRWCIDEPVQTFLAQLIIICNLGVRWNDAIRRRPTSHVTAGLDGRRHTVHAEVSEVELAAGKTQVNLHDAE